MNTAVTNPKLLYAYLYSMESTLILRLVLRAGSGVREWCG